MKILHIVPSFAPAYAYGGPIVSTLELCRALVRCSGEVRVLTTNANGKVAVLDVATDCDAEMIPGLRVRYCHRVAAHSIAPALLAKLLDWTRWADVVHLTGVYSFPTIPSLLTCRVLEKPVVWSPRGALQRWEGTRRVRLKAIWETFCHLVAPKRLILHVTSDNEALGSRKLMPGVQVVMIPNGIEVPDHVMRVPSNGTLRLLYLGRLDSIKGIENLLEACALLSRRNGLRWKLAIAGDGHPRYVKTLETLIQNLDLYREVQLVGHVQGEAKRNVYEQSDLAVVPSYTENFGMVVAEALAYGVPVIASRGTPWKRVEEIGCGLWVNNDPTSLAEAIRRIDQMPLREMGQKGREWMEKEFAWSRVAQDMIQLYGRMIVNAQ